MFTELFRAIGPMGSNLNGQKHRWFKNSMKCLGQDTKAPVPRVAEILAQLMFSRDLEFMKRHNNFRWGVNIELNYTVEDPS